MLIGQIDFGSTLGPSMPSGLFSQIGVDGNHYAIASLGGTDTRLGCAETETVVWTRTQAEWRTDLAGLSLGTSGAYSLDSAIPAPGTPYFYIVGYQLDTGGAGGKHDVVLVRYKIVDTTTVQVDGGFAYRTSTHATVLATGYTWGAAVIDGTLYAVMDTGTFSPFTLCSHLLKLPLTGSDGDLTNGSWDAFVTLLPWVYTTNRPTSSRQYYNTACIIDDPNGIGVLAYLASPEGQSPAVAYYTVCDTVAHSATGPFDVSADLGVPFADSGLNLAGAAGTSRDEYTAPYQGDDGIIYWARAFSDDPQQCRVRMATQDGAGNFIVGDVLNFHFTDETIPSGLNQAIEFVMIYHEGDELLWMARSNQTYIFGSEPEPGGGGAPPTAVYPPTTSVDTVDDLPPADAVIVTQRWLVRTGHIRQWGEIAIDDLRLTIKRGVGDTEDEPKIWVRVNRDNKGFGKWAKRGLGKKGDRFMTICLGGFGSARDWQFEVATTDVCEIELRKMEILPTQLGH